MRARAAGEGRPRSESGGLRDRALPHVRPPAVEGRFLEDDGRRTERRRSSGRACPGRRRGRAAARGTPRRPPSRRCLVRAAQRGGRGTSASVSVRPLEALHPAARPEVELVEGGRLGPEGDEWKETLEGRSFSNLRQSTRRCSPQRAASQRAVPAKNGKRVFVPAMPLSRERVAVAASGPRAGRSARGAPPVVRGTRRIVRVGAQEAERLVKALDLRRACGAGRAPRTRERGEPASAAPGAGSRAAPPRGRSSASPRGHARVLRGGPSERPARSAADSASAHASSVSRRTRRRRARGGRSRSRRAELVREEAAVFLEAPHAVGREAALEEGEARERRVVGVGGAQAAPRATPGARAAPTPSRGIRAAAVREPSVSS